VLNGTQPKGTSRTFGYEATYGVLDPYWNAPALPSALNPTPTTNLVGQLQTIMDATARSRTTLELQPADFADESRAGNSHREWRRGAA
jgi:hypothetical protein